MIHLSQTAVDEVNRMKKKHANPAALFRVGVQAGGCCDYYYTLSLSDGVDPTDYVIACHGIQVVIDADSLRQIDGLSLDYSEDLMGGGFRFNNPHATQSCGCGNSFGTGQAA